MPTRENPAGPDSRSDRPERRVKIIAGDVLAIDDQASVIEEVRKYLEPMVGAIAAFTDPNEAIRHLKAGEVYRVILLDLVMEPLSGLELLRFIRDIDSNAKVIVLTGHGSLDSAIKALQLGAVDYVTKPIEDWTSLVASIKRALNEHHLQEENERLVAEIQQQNVELNRSVSLMRTLTETSEMMHAARDVGVILNILVQRACDVLTARRVSIMIRDPDREEIGIQVAAGMSSAVLEEVRIKPGEGIAGRVILERKAIVVDDAATDPRLPQSQDRDERYSSRSFMCIPIFLKSDADKEQVIGVVNVTDRLLDRPFTDNEVEFVSHLARQAALALASAALWTTKG